MNNLELGHISAQYDVAHYGRAVAEDIYVAMVTVTRDAFSTGYKMGLDS